MCGSRSLVYMICSEAFNNIRDTNVPYGKLVCGNCIRRPSRASPSLVNSSFRYRASLGIFQGKQLDYGNIALSYSEERFDAI